MHLVDLSSLSMHLNDLDFDLEEATGIPIFMIFHLSEFFSPSDALCRYLEDSPEGYF